MKLDRRTLLAAATAGGATLAGCTGGCGQGVPFLGTDMPHDGELAVESVGSVPGEATILQFSELSAAEQSLVETALEDGVARVCMDDDSDRADALGTLAGHVRQETYLAYDGDRYGLYLRVTDVVYATTADSPDSDANPCC